MDSKDNIYDAHRSCSSDYDDEEEESMDNYFDDSDTKANADVDARADSLFIEEDFYPSEKNYIVLKEADIHQRMEDNITEVSDVLSIPKPEASIVLRHYDWSVGKVNDAWFVDEYGVREKVGLFDKPVIQLPSKSTRKLITCGICFESYDGNRFCWASCGHTFCSDCFASLINVSINDGVGCLMLRCPEPSCKAAIGQDMIDKLASEENKDKYSRYLFRSYIENNKKIKWCPAPGCDYAVDFDVGGGSFDVSCLCSHRFCWNCIEEAHRPVDCDTVAKWILKNKSDAENTNWILVHTKPCPKCKRPIEKNQGCMHMTCTKTCRFEFCWVCLQDWSSHASIACNRYREDHTKEERAKKLAAKHLERYAHYYVRWAANEVSMKKAFADLQQVQSMQIEKLCYYQCQTEGQLKFITEAWQQIVECRRILKWTYAYGYYLPMDELAKKQFFEYSQGEAESALERLHHCAEKEVEVFLDANHSRSQKFNGFRSKLTGLTKVTKTFFDNLVNALENGLSDVVGSSQKSRKSKEYLVDVAGSSKKRKKSEEYVVESATAQDNSRNDVVTTSSTNVVDYTAQGPWTCEYCSYANDYTAMACQICNQGSWSCDHCNYANLRNATECEVCNKPR